MFINKINERTKNTHVQLRYMYNIDPKTGPSINPRPVNASANPMNFSLLEGNS